MKDLLPIFYTMGYIWIGYITGWICYEFYEKWDLGELIGIGFFWPVTLPIVLMHVIVDNIKTRRHERKNREANILKKLHKYRIKLINKADTLDSASIDIVAFDGHLAAVIALKYFVSESDKWLIADIKPLD